jgi:hypothetical protein
MRIRTLSSYDAVPFNNALENFFDTYKTEEDIECYQLYYDVFSKKPSTCFDDLNQIKFESRVVILNVIDTLTDNFDSVDIDGLTQFCANHPEQNFIFFSPHLGFQKTLNISNLYSDTIVCTDFGEKFQHCEKKNITNQWLSLNANPKLHRLITLCYLLSKDYYKNGLITHNNIEFTNNIFKFDGYKDMSKMPEWLKTEVRRGYAKLKSKNLNKLQLENNNIDGMIPCVYNYNTFLKPIYENIGIEIITGTHFFEKNPVLSEKEIQSVYAKNFPIYINGPGMSKEMKELFDIDIFEDIIDHSYDEIANHFERLSTAIDRNTHLLDGSTNISELWYDNRKRFEDNCEQMDNMIHEGTYKTNFTNEKIKKALTYFGVSFS